MTSRVPAVLVVLALLAPPAWAQEDVVDRASRLAEAGIAAYEAADYRAALARFSGAIALVPEDTVLMYFMGRTNEKLNQTDAAIAYYEAYLRAGPDPANVPQVQAALGSLRAARRSPTGQLTVVTHPPGARVGVDGRDVGTAPIGPLPVSAGPHLIAASLPNAPAAVREVDVQDGQNLTTEIALKVAARPQPEPPKPSPVRPPVPSPPPAESSGTGAMVGLALGAASAAGAVGAYLLTSDALDDAQSASDLGDETSYDDAIAAAQLRYMFFWGLAGVSALSFGYAGWSLATAAAAPGSFALTLRTTW